MKPLFLLFVYCGCTISSLAQTLSGTVVEVFTGEPVLGVQISGEEQNAVTDQSGEFDIEIGIFPATMTVSHLGYQTQTIRVASAEDKLAIRLNPQTTQLDEVIVTGYNNAQRLLEVPSAVGVINSEVLAQTNGQDFHRVLPRIPGVQVDFIGRYNNRIVLRGVGARAGAGTRNIKLYLDDIPLTEASGFGWIGGINPNLLSKTEVIKGPASSAYGAGTGGVIHFHTKRPDQLGTQFQYHSQVGSLGLQDNGFSFQYADATTHWHAEVHQRQTDGYRGHSNSDSRQLLLNGQFYQGTRRTLSVLVARYEQRSENPGALNSDQLAERTQANPIFEQNNASRDQAITRIGISHQYQLTNTFSNTTSVFSSFHNLDFRLPPFIMRASMQDFGGRTRFELVPTMSWLPTTFILGGEYQSTLFHHSRYRNQAGALGDVIINQFERSQQGFAFLQTETALSDRWRLNLGASINQVSFTVDNFLAPGQSGERHFRTVLSPRVAISFLPDSRNALHASVSRGFSPPSIQEMRKSDGSFNFSIRPELGTNHEIIWKGNSRSRRLIHEINVFYFRGIDQLIAQTLADGVTVVQNAGSTHQWGGELSLRYRLLKNETAWITEVNPYLNGFFYDMTYDTYEVSVNGREQNFSGNALTGIVPIGLTAGVEVKFRPDLSLYADYQYRDETPADDANTVYNPAYGLVNLKTSWTRPIGKQWVVNISGGTDNLTNTEYNSFVNLNATSDNENTPVAFFYPAAKRTYYVSIKIDYHLPKK